MRSHFQALDQCRKFLVGNNLAAIPAFDTAGAAKQIAHERLRSVAAIASTQSALDCGLKVLVSNIQDQHDNHTRFLSIEMNPLPDSLERESMKTSVAFCIDNVDGSLFKTLAAFGSRRGVSIIRIESRPLVGTSTRWRNFARSHEEGQDTGVWDLVYYVDFVGPLLTTQSVVDHLAELVMVKDGVKALQVLGTYPEGKLRDITGDLWRK